MLSRILASFWSTCVFLSLLFSLSVSSLIQSCGFYYTCQIWPPFFCFVSAKAARVDAGDLTGIIKGDVEVKERNVAIPGSKGYSTSYSTKIGLFSIQLLIIYTCIHLRNTFCYSFNYCHFHFVFSSLQMLVGQSFHYFFLEILSYGFLQCIY